MSIAAHAQRMKGPIGKYCVSSVRIAPETRAALYRDPNFNGESLELSGDVPNLQLEKALCPHDGLNDCVSAIRIGNP